MPFKDTWIDQDETMDASPEVVNSIAHAVIKNEEDIAEIKENGGTGGGSGEDGFSPLATVTQTENGAEISITDVNGTTTATILNGKDGYTPQRGIDYWIEEDKAEITSYIDSAINGTVAEALEGDY